MGVLSFAAVVAFGQQQVNLTAGPASLTMPDGSSVPMWGYTCAGTTDITGSTATCAKSNPAATGWSPVVITVPTGQGLTINLTNSLTFGANSVPTSLVIVGQLGGGLGTTAKTVPSPDHSFAQSNATWPIAGTGPANPALNQGPRVQSFSTEVTAGATESLTWTAANLRPGTYLIESGTHPSIQGPMGLYGMLVVTTAPVGTTAGTAYPGVSYGADVPLLLSEIDPVQNNAVQTAVGTAGFSETKVWSGQPGGCGNPSSGAGVYQTCYPPAVNYTPLYYLFNGIAFDKTNASASLFKASPVSGVTGNVLVRFVNAGLRMHVPSIVGALTGTTAVAGLGLIAEDGNPLPGVTRVQSEVFLAAGKTYDVMVNVPAGGTALPVFDRQLSLSGNAIARDAGMLAYIGVNGAGLPTTGAFSAANTAVSAVADTYNAVIAGRTLTVSDPAKGVIANDTNVYGVKVVPGSVVGGTLTLSTDGTFTFAATDGSGSFTYCGNGATTGLPPACALVTLGAAAIEANTGITCTVPTTSPTYSSTAATTLSIKPPGILSFCKDAAGYPLTVHAGSVTSTGFTTLSVDPNGGFNAVVPAAGTHSFTFLAENSQGTVMAGTGATVTLNFPAGSGLAVSVLDGANKSPITDYRWIIEEDLTFFVDPACTTNPLPSTCPTINTQGTPFGFGTNFHTSHMPLIASGCTGPLSCESGQTVLAQGAVCDVGNGVCRTDATQQTALDPGKVYLDPTKRYYISVLPGDAANPFQNGYTGKPDCSTAGMAAGHCGHGMGGAPIAKGQTSVTVLSQPTPFPPAKLTVFVFEDDFPLNGEHDAGGGIDILSPNEPGLGGFAITIQDFAGGTGDATGQPTYDMFNMPLSNSLAGTLDPTTGKDACPISPVVTASTNPTTGDGGTQKGIIGMVVTCPTFESDGTTLSPLAGQAVIANLYPGRYGVVATPAADRIARGEEWLQTNTLDGQKAHDAFLRIGEPAYFQEFGPAGYHVTIGFASPGVINARKPGLCTADPCSNEVKGHVTTARMSRTPDERLYGSGTHDSYAFSQCYAALGDPDGATFAFVKCDNDGNFDFTGLPSGNFKLTLFDQWNDQVVDGISLPVGLAGQSGASVDLGEIASHQWQANIYTSTFFDQNGDGVRNGNETGLALVATNIRFRDGSYSNFNSTDLNGNAGFNEVFPLFNWYVVETDSTRFKSTGTHVVYDAGGQVDVTSNIAAHLANTTETISLPNALRVPGAVYCSTADCTGSSVATGPVTGGSSGPTTGLSTGRIDPPTWFDSYGWQGFAGQNNFLEFGKRPFIAGENGGIHGHVVYASTRPFDDPQLLLQLSWEPLIPNVQINLYKKGLAADGVTSTLTLVDTTKTSSFDDWAQGFRSDGVPNMNCPGQSNDPTFDPFYLGIQNQPSYLDWYNSQHGGPAVTPLPNNSQFKCYDGMHNWNQLQPAPYDGMYSFPSVTSYNPATGRPAGSNCTGCVLNPDLTDPFRSGTPMLPAGKYVVEVVVPPGYELVKEEDKNILIGDNYIAPATQQFGGLGSIYILPDQASVGYNGYNAQNSTTSLGRVSSLPSHEGDTGSDETFWPCVGTARVVPDYISLFPGSAEVAPFAGATRNLCDRKEVSLDDQTSVLTKFYLFTSTHIASHFTGVITDDFTAEFDPFSPQFGEKFGPAYLPVAIKDWAGNEINRIYADQWGAYNGLNYSTWEVNPPNPTGYGPTMMVTCMNDAGTGITPDPLYQPSYSQFCYELPFMPGQTGYFDTPVVPTSAHADGFNTPDCSYPDATPAISSVTGDVAGPWVSAAGAGHTLTINALGDQSVNSYAYTGPQVNTAPYNQQKVTRHYGFGATQGTGSVTIGGISAPVTSWSDTSITVTVPSGVPNCAVQQQGQYFTPPITSGTVPTAQCGQLIITAANGKASVDAVTVTIGGNKPTVMTAGQTIQNAIDTANPGDLIIVPPGVYSEILLMWKPVRLQGVGAASSIIDASPHPAGKMDPWRKQVVCLFGLTPDGRPNASDTSCSSGWANASGGPDYPTMLADRVPMEGILGWDTTVNGNLAEQLIEPSLIGAYEGAAVTVVGKGVKIPAGAADVYGSGAESAFPAGSTLLSAQDCATGSPIAGTGSALKNLYPTNYYCNPSSIDGLSLTNSSQGGGGIFVHAWGHNIQIANNRIHNNQGTLSGGITVGQAEHVDVSLAGTANAITNIPPGSCETSSITNLALPFCYNLAVNVHNNAVTLNSSLGDELFSSTPAGAGGVTLCNGADYYQFNYNWVCGNMSTGDGGGVAHIGFIKNGTIANNSILFNQSTNPTITTNGGGLLIMGAPDPDPPCATSDQDCLSAPNTITPSDGTGPGLVINGNLIMGNSADSGSGGGLRLQHINGNDVINFPNGAGAGTSATAGHCNTQNLVGCRWNTVTITNNIIANNVAGWDGGGVSLLDALAVNIVNNTIVSNDSTASSGVLFGSLFANLASTAPETTGVNCSTTSFEQSCPQIAGLVSVTNSAVLTANLPAGVTCPAGHGNCTSYSNPVLANNVIWQNRSFIIGVSTLNASGLQNQQKLISLFNSSFPTTSTPTLAPSQSATGACPAASYWDIGVRGDTSPTPTTGRSLAPAYSVLSSTTGYATTNLASNPALVSQYCNGSRVPPELGSMGYLLTPGTNETQALPTPVFTLSASATVDEGNNWVNMRWGPLALTHPVTGNTLGNYALAQNSPAVDAIPSTSPTYALAPSTDIFGNRRPDPDGDNTIDIGAVEFQGSNGRPKLTSIAPISGPRGYSVPVTLTGTNLTGATAVNVSGTGVNLITVSNVVVVNDTTVTALFAIPAGAAVTGANAAHTVSVTAPTGTSNTVTFTVINPPAPRLTSIAPTSGGRGTVFTVTLTGTSLLTVSAVTVSGTGVTASAVTPVNDTTVTATLTITASAALTARGISVTNVTGNSNVVGFAVTGPTLTSIAPSSGARGTSVPVTLTGTGLTGATSVTVSGAGVTAAVPTVVNDTTVTTTLTITAGAGLTGRNVAVVTPIGTTNNVTFTVGTPPQPTLSTVAPNTFVRGTTTTAVTLTGTNFVTGATVAVSGAGVTVSAVTVVSATQITATFTVTNGAAVGAHGVTVTTAGGTSIPAVNITVQGPTLTSITPNTGMRATSVPVVLAGTNLTGATAVNVSGAGVTCSGITSTASSVNATCAITAGAALGLRTVTVNTPIGNTTDVVNFTVVNQPVAALTSVAPNSSTLAQRGTTVPVTLVGTNFTTGSTVAVSGAGITVSGVTVVSSTQITANFAIGAGALNLGAHNVTVTNASGTASNSQTFTKN